MADIDVERKGPSIWPWIIGLIVLALLIWLLVELFGGGRDADPLEQPVATAPVGEDTAFGERGAGALPAEVQRYLAGCTEQTGAPEGEMGREHEFTVECLRQLRDGIEAVVRRDQIGETDVSQRLERYGEAVRELEESQPEATSHAQLTGRAARNGAEVLEAMGNARFSGEQRIQQAVSAASSAAGEVEAETALLEQREPVRTFFREAGQALRLMAQQQPARR